MSVVVLENLYKSKRTANLSGFNLEQDFHINKKIHTNEQIIIKNTDFDDSFILESSEFLNDENLIFWEKEEEDYKLLDELKFHNKKKFKSQLKKQRPSNIFSEMPYNIFNQALLQIGFFEMMLQETVKNVKFH